MRFYLLILFALFAFSCGNSSNVSNNKPQVNGTKSPSNNVNNSSAKTSGSLPVYGYEIVNTYKHDPKAFTQGLVIHKGTFYESDGQYNESTLRKVEIESGKVIQKVDLPDEIFAEGLTAFNDKLYQISWREKRAFVWDLDLKLQKEFPYQGEGWGLTHDGKNLIMSDGTHVIKFINPEDFQTVSTISVLRENGQPLMNINELEYVKGEIWANIWHSEAPESINKPNYIARIDPKSGKLLGWIDLAGISPEDSERGSENVLNGIAYDEATDRIFVTGKSWKRLFEIKLKAKQ